MYIFIKLYIYINMSYIFIKGGVKEKWRGREKSGAYNPVL